MICCSNSSTHLKLYDTERGKGIINQCVVRRRFNEVNVAIALVIIPEVGRDFT